MAFVFRSLHHGFSVSGLLGLIGHRDFVYRTLVVALNDYDLDIQDLNRWVVHFQQCLPSWDPSTEFVSCYRLQGRAIFYQLVAENCDGSTEVPIDLVGRRGKGNYAHLIHFLILLPVDFHGFRHSVALFGRTFSDQRFALLSCWVSHSAFGIAGQLGTGQRSKDKFETAVQIQQAGRSQGSNHHSRVLLRYER